jgi:hypothetical protein
MGFRIVDGSCLLSSSFWAWALWKKLPTLEETQNTICQSAEDLMWYSSVLTRRLPLPTFSCCAQLVCRHQLASGVLGSHLAATCLRKSAAPSRNLRACSSAPAASMRRLDSRAGTGAQSE